MFDALMFIQYTEAKSRNTSRFEEILSKRFRPEMKKAVEAWLKTDPFNNSAAPNSPFEMPEYVQKQQVEAKEQNVLAAKLTASADVASRHSDTYLLLTVIFASVLFFGGISGTFDSPSLQRTMTFLALILFGITIIALAMMPICPD